MLLTKKKTLCKFLQIGNVYYGILDGKEVAIKRAHLSSIQSSSGFRNEVLLLSRLHHKNLVRLLGFCEDKGIQVNICFLMLFNSSAIFVSAEQSV